MNGERELERDKTFSDQSGGFVCPAAYNTLQIGVLCCLLDEELTFLWGNDWFFSRIGYSETEFRLLFRGLRQFYADLPEDLAALGHEAARVREPAGSGFELTSRLPLRSGGFAWVRFYGAAADGVAAGPAIQISMADVGALEDEKEEHSRLRQQSLQYFRWMLDTYIGNIYISDTDTYELLYLNQSSCDTLGKPARELVGRKCYEVIQGRDAPCPFCTNEKLREDAFYEWEFFNPALERTFMIKNRLINWEGRRARIELSHDMYSAEYKLAKKDREREAFIRSVPGGFARLDARDLSTVLWYGAEFLNLIGYTAEQFENELHAQCTYIHPDDLDRILPQLMEIKNAGGSLVTEARVITRSGAVKLITLTLAYASEEDSWDGIPSFYSVGIDVTKERREQERQRQALEDACRTARIASEAKTNFLSSMSHDIRTPMNAIMGMTVIAQANLDNPEKMGDCLSKINASGRHLLNLINEVLDMSRIESGKIDLVTEEVNLPDLVQDVMDMCRPLAEEKRQEFQVSAQSVRHERIVADGGRLQQALLNLLSNAMKYTQEGGKISLRIRELPSIVEGKGQYEFIVEDNGIGMSEEFIPHLFEPFSRAEDTRVNQIQGTGLGMAITENVVHMMNGTIEVRSKPGEGSQFIVAAPFEQCGEEASLEKELAGLSVLVVDDDEIGCESAAALLSELNMQVQWVLSGEEAIGRLQEAHRRGQDYFAVVMDWKMPGMDGLEAVRAIREKLGAAVPILAVSACDDSDIGEEFRQAGADAFITKPLFKSKMASALRRFCKSGRSEAVSAPLDREYSRMAGKRLLVVEDSALNREIAKELLQMYGFLIDEAENGRRAVERFQESAVGTYDCILMDIQMPVMDGYEATRAIRALNRKDAKRIPILALTANAFASDLGRAHNAGMNDHIAKPIDIQVLMDALQKWIL